jgi:hypothetical protein
MAISSLENFIIIKMKIKKEDFLKKLCLFFFINAGKALLLCFSDPFFVLYLSIIVYFILSL